MSYDSEEWRDEALCAQTAPDDDYDPWASKGTA